MKKILIVLALLASVQLSYAQKSADAVKKAVAAAEAACANEKKATKVATWLKLAQVNLEAYAAPSLNGWVGATKQDLEIVMSNFQPIERTHETYMGETYDIEIYPACKYYYQNGVIQMISVTKHYVDDPLGNAFKALKKAAEVDPAGTKTKEITESLTKVAQNYQVEALNSYHFGNFTDASKYFALSAEASGTAPLSVVDSSSIFNAGFTAYMANQYELAKGYFEKSIAMKYYENGDAFAKLAECFKQLGNMEEFKSTLEQGFSVCPNSQGILIGLINHYIEAKEDPSKLFLLLEKAKENEPNNASLFYVEGNIHKQLGDFDGALAAYDKCIAVNPEYEYGEIGKGFLYNEMAEKIAEEAQKEFDDRKYAVLVDKFEDSLLKAAVPFQKAYEITKDEEVKASLAEFIKNIYFRFRDKNDEYKALYDKFNEIVKQNQQK